MTENMPKKPLQILLTQEQRATLEKAAREAGLTLGAYIRTRALLAAQQKGKEA